MAVIDRIRKIHNTLQHVEPGPGCVGIWVDSDNRLKFKDDEGSVYTVFDPLAGGSGFGQQVRLTATFDEADTLSVTFQKDVEITVTADVVTFTEGDIVATDVGRIIAWTGFSGIIASLDSATTATVYTLDGNLSDGAHTATVGEDMDDAEYQIISIVAPDALEIFSYGNLATSGFDLYSSNAVSVAVVTVTVIR